MSAQPHAFPSPARNVSHLSAARSQAAAEAVFSSEALLQGRREILIRHGDRVYRLRHTSNDKLILTK